MNATVHEPADLDVVLARWLRDTERTAPDRLLITFDPAAEAAVQALGAARPAAVDVRMEDGQLLVEVTSAEVGVLDLLALHAETADLRALRRYLTATLPLPRTA
ncbi:hypothetical protein [Pseudonocardia pini]|uniref:hypothetical protein n=1 Tax=Pseudonocardia pini TaxID=2758030 RepID=UPI0015EFE7C2|nr:hypothetical protein [Pseudonocardia pini]